MGPDRRDVSKPTMYSILLRTHMLLAATLILAVVSPRSATGQTTKEIIQSRQFLLRGMPPVSEPQRDSARLSGISLMPAPSDTGIRILPGVAGVVIGGLIGGAVIGVVALGGCEIPWCDHVGRDTRSGALAGAAVGLMIETIIHVIH
jgi:hypothetical protein